MKKFLLIIAVFIGLMATVTAQDNKGGNGKNDGSRIEALKIAYLTKKLNLSTEEAQKFWPIYNKYSDEIRAARIEAKTSNEKEINTE
jgi:hypothetical protein